MLNVSACVCVCVTTGSSYLTYINNVNQLVMMATQIYNDACVPSHHKYIAHQLALLYVSQGPCNSASLHRHRSTWQAFQGCSMLAEVHAIVYAPMQPCQVQNAPYRKHSYPTCWLLQQ